MGSAALETIAFVMQLNRGAEAEYRRRHDEIWPELASALHDAGVRDYSIFLDPSTYSLFAVLKLEPGNTRSELPTLPIMKRWWDYMADLMAVDPTNRPIERPLKLMFHQD